ncbi:hypothetical protein ABT187_49980, partial [Streptomyces sp. NPDC001817]|uniref:hypothetical protein n=1 Tax=Streptomyces sp. NPDC001817 TaxID=3154398 RepID=UPI00331AED21
MRRRQEATGGRAVELERVRRGWTPVNSTGWWRGSSGALAEDPDPPAVPGRMWSLGLYRPVVLVLFLLRHNAV